MFVILSERGEKETGTKIQHLFLGSRLPQDVPKRGVKGITEKQAGKSNRYLFKRVTERLETAVFFY